MPEHDGDDDDADVLTLWANSEDPDEMLHITVFHQVLFRFCTVY